VSASDMDKYVAQQNVERFQRMLAAAADHEDREQIRALLAEAYAALRATQPPSPDKDIGDSGR